MVIGNSNFSAEKNTNVHDIIKVYNRLSSLYEINYIKGDYKKAFNNAKEQLKIDPADIVAYMRLAAAAQFVELDKEKLKSQYHPFVSEKDKLHIELKSLANTFLSAKENK